MLVFGGEYAFFENDFSLSEMEAVLARGDRKVGKVIQRAYELGCYLDGWTDKFKATLWNQAFIDMGVDKTFYTREWGEDEILPWDFIDLFIDKKFLLKERKKAYASEVTGSCKSGCKGCGIQKVYGCKI